MELSGEKSKIYNNQKLWELFGQLKEYIMHTYPEWATYEGDHRYDDKITDYSELAVKNHFKTLKKFLSELEKIDFELLTEENKLNYDLFREDLMVTVEAEPFNLHYMAVDQLNGFHINLPQIVEVQPLNTGEDYQKYFLRLKNAAAQFENIIENMRKGLSAELLLPELTIKEIMGQLHDIADMPTEKMPFYTLENENKLSEAEKKTVSIELTEILNNYIKPAYNNFYGFLKNEYLPHARKTAGIWSVPGGEEIYAYNTRFHTSTLLSPEEIHQIGLQEVARIKEEMEKVKSKTGFQGTLQEFNNYLKNSPEFYYSDKKDLLNGYREILKKMDAKLASMFGKLPKAKYEVKEIEEYRARSAPQAYYYSAPEDRSRPGYFYANTYDLSARPKYTMTALSLHEAVPGHHLQIALAQELEALPWFRKQLSVTSYIEGWALYAESLGYECGMYDDLYQHYGALTYEMERACRLVIDTGLHYKKWTREQAIDYLKDNTPSADVDVIAEIDRYIVWPGQALAYKIGELKIKELRRVSEEKLGSRFDIREFHDKTLLDGTLPLSVLEKNIYDWIDKKQSKA